MMLDVRHTAPVNYPAGYEPRKRRFSVSSESYHPELFVDQTVRAVPQKTEDVRPRVLFTPCAVLFTPFLSFSLLLLVFGGRFRPFVSSPQVAFPF